MLNENLRGQPCATCGRYKPNAQELRLYTSDSARFPGSERGDVELLILRVDVSHRALQNNAHRGGRSAENRLPAYRGAAIGSAGKARQRKLRPRSRAAGKCFVVKAKANVARGK